MRIQRTLSWIACIGLGTGIGRWLVIGGPWLLIVVFGTLALPTIGISYYGGYRHGQDDMRVEIKAKLNAIPRTPWAQP